jgi:hypothetical protein
MLRRCRLHAVRHWRALSTLVDRTLASWHLPLRPLGGMKMTMAPRPVQNFKYFDFEK